MRELGILTDGAILVHDGRIEEIGPTRRVENLALARRAAREIDATGRVVLPGFVDSLTYWRETRVRTFLAVMARHGTTTLQARPCPEAGPALRLKILRALTALDGHPLDIVPACTEPLPHNRRLPRMLSLAPCASVADAVSAGAPAIENLEHPSAADIAALARSATVAMFTPAPCPCASARALIDGGAAVAIATGFHPQSSPGYSMQTVISLACSRLRLTPAEAICAATVNAAWACGSAARAGSLEPGKDADFLLLNLSDYRELPYYFGANHVHLTVKRGEIV